MTSRMRKKLNDSFHQIFDDPANLSDYVSYYRALVTWVKEFMGMFRVFNDYVQNTDRLKNLINLDPNKYIIEDLRDEKSLQSEKNRIGSCDYKSLESFVMTLSDTLWDMVTVTSGIDCPICDGDELKFVLAVYPDERQELTLECDQCGYSQHLDGRRWREGMVEVFPIAKEDIKTYLRMHNYLEYLDHLDKRLFESNSIVKREDGNSMKGNEFTKDLLHFFVNILQKLTDNY